MGWFGYALISVAAYGMINFLFGIMAKRGGGMTSCYAMCFGFIPILIVYRVCWTPPVSYKGNYWAIGGVIFRGSLSFLIYFVHITAFSFAVGAGINVGVISAILTLAVFFAALLFYLFYGEKLSCGDWIGASLIVAGTSMIGLF